MICAARDAPETLVILQSASGAYMLCSKFPLADHGSCCAHYCAYRQVAVQQSLLTICLCILYSVLA